MTYEAWRCTFQSAEAAARAAYGQVQGAVAEAAGLREKLEARCPGLVQIQEPAPRSKVLAAILAARGALQHLKEGGKHSEILFKEALQAIDSVVAPIESTQAAPAQPAEGVPAPVLYVSKEQLNNHRDHADSEAGRYLPCRITPAGKFTTPLYAAPQAQAEDARDAQWTEQQIDAAARTLSECMDYPWQGMTAQGKQQMRAHARTILSAAIAAAKGE